jgi:hypothetical protein
MRCVVRYRVDLEIWVHEQIVALQCDSDMRAAALSYEATLPEGHRQLPGLSNQRLPFLPEGIDLMEVYRFVTRRCTAMARPATAARTRCSAPACSMLHAA